MKCQSQTNTNIVSRTSLYLTNPFLQSVLLKHKVYFKILSWPSPGGAEENHENRLSGYSVSGRDSRLPPLEYKSEAMWREDMLLFVTSAAEYSELSVCKPFGVMYVTPLWAVCRSRLCSLHQLWISCESYYELRWHKLTMNYYGLWHFCF
jgi:hypothetical protein